MLLSPAGNLKRSRILSSFPNCFWVQYLTANSVTCSVDENFVIIRSTQKLWQNNYANTQHSFCQRVATFSQRKSQRQGTAANSLLSFNTKCTFPGQGSAVRVGGSIVWSVDTAHPEKPPTSFLNLLNTIHQRCSTQIPPHVNRRPSFLAVELTL